MLTMCFWNPKFSVSPTAADISPHANTVKYFEPSRAGELVFVISDLTLVLIIPDEFKSSDFYLILMN